MVPDRIISERKGRSLINLFSESKKPSLFGSKGFDTGIGTPRSVKI